MTRKELLIAAIFTFITVSAWAIFNVLHARAQVEISPKIKEAIEPIDPKFNSEVVKSLP